MSGNTIESGTKCPESKHWATTYPIYGFLEISLFNRFLVHIWTKPYLLAIIADWVDLPEPGGPKIRTLGGLLGALLLYLILSILAKSLATSFCYLSIALYS